MNLKDNKLTTEAHGIVYCEEYVKDAVLEDQENFRILMDNVVKHLMKSGVDEQVVMDVSVRLAAHGVITMKEVFGDWEIKTMKTLKELIIHDGNYPHLHAGNVKEAVKKLKEYQCDCQVLDHTCGLCNAMDGIFGDWENE